VGLLDHPAWLETFFTRLAELDAGRAKTDVHIVQFGDSHTQPDLETSAIRRALQARFGDGGRGFVPILRPVKTRLQAGVHVGLGTEWRIDRMRTKKGVLTGDGLYGLAGVAAVATRGGDPLWVEVSASSRVEVAYLEQPRGGTFDVKIDGALAARVKTAGDEPRSSFRSFELADVPHRIELYPRGDGEVRVFGIDLDRAAFGVTLDALGIGATQAAGILEWNVSHFVGQLRRRAPDLVILAYGTNEAGSSVSAPAYEKQLQDVIDRVMQSSPRPSCLLLGPPDWVRKTPHGPVTPQELLDVIATQRSVAARMHCAYFSQFDAMGGAQSMEVWATASPPLGGKDRVHLTRTGYERLGDALAKDFIAAYDDWRLTVHTRRPAPLHPVTPPASFTNASTPLEKRALL
jgi:lysophospholipase L1-like esterase